MAAKVNKRVVNVPRKPNGASGTFLVLVGEHVRQDPVKLAAVHAHNQTNPDCPSKWLTTPTEVTLVAGDTFTASGDEAEMMRADREKFQEIA